MADIKYRGYFTIRNNGEDVPAKVEIFTGAGSVSESAVVEISMGPDPAVITWDTATLVDCVHPSQMKVSLLASHDGQYRDLKDSEEAITAVLYVRTGSVWRAWWRGMLGQLTWEEPFSRSTNYMIEMSFSDFGYLSRKKYDESVIAGDRGVARVSDIITAIMGAVYGAGSTADVEFYTDRVARSKMAGTLFRNLRVHTRIFYDSEGEPRYLRDIVEDILSPVCGHIIQHGGKIHVFIPDYYTYSAYASAFPSIKAAGIDARLSIAEAYSRITLKYNQDPDGVIAELKFNAEDTGYEGPWQYVNNGGYRQFLLCGPEYTGVLPTGNGYKANYIDGTRVTPCLWLVNGWATQFHVPPGFSAPGDMPDELSGVSVILSMSFPVSSADTSRGDGYPPVTTELKVTVPVLISFGFIGEIHDVMLKAYVSLTPTDPSEPSLYLNDDGWSETSNGLLTLHYDGQGSSDYPQDWPIAWQNIVGSIPVPGVQGIITLIIYPGMLTTDYTYTGDVTTGDDSPEVVMYAIGDISVEEPDNYTSQRVVSANTITKETGKDAEDFEKDFAMGTPVLLSLGTYTSFISEDYNESVQEDETFLNFYSYLLFRNHLGSRRWIVKGTYRYDHLSWVLPLFSPLSSIPLSTLEILTYNAYFIRSEVWHARTGESELELEAFSTFPYV